MRVACEARSHGHRGSRREGDRLMAGFAEGLLITGQRQHHRGFHQGWQKPTELGYRRVTALNQHRYLGAAATRRDMRRNSEINSRGRRLTNLEIGLHGMATEERNARRQVEFYVAYGNSTPDRLVGGCCHQPAV